MTGRLHEVVGVEETIPDFGPSTVLRGPAGAGQRRPCTGEASWRDLERLCLRAEREGPQVWQQALPLLKQHVEAFPQDAQAWVQLARALLSQEDRGQALRAAQKAFRLTPDAAFGHAVSLLLARSFCDAQHWDAAARQCEAALASQPGNEEALEMLVWSKIGQEEVAGGEAALAALSKANAEQAAWLAQQLASRSQRAEERRRWLRHAAAWPKCPARPLRDLGEACLVLQQNDEALRCFERAFAQADGAKDHQLARALGQLHVRAGRVEEALSIYHTAMAAAPDSLPLHKACWQLLLKEGRSREALGVLAQGAAVAPPQEAAPIFATLAELQQSLGRNSEALQSWRQSAELDGSSVGSWKGLLNAAAAAGAPAEQARALRQLSQLEPEEPEWRARLGLLLAEGEAKEEARQHFSRALSLQPSHVPALLGMAELNPGAAVEYFERAARADPTSETALLGAARARWQGGDREQATAYYRKVLALQPGHAEALLHIAITALAEQNLGEARSHLTRAAKVDSEFQPEALAWLSYTKLLLGAGAEAEEGFQEAQERVSCEPAQSRVRLQRCVALLDRGKEEAALAELPHLLAGTSPVQRKLARLQSDGTLRAALADGRPDDAGLGDDLPGLPARFGRRLEAFLCSAPAPLQSFSKLGVPSASLGQASSGAAVPAVGTAASQDEGWRDTLHEGQAVEVYSKSACKWLASTVALVSAETVKVKYLVDGQWCEKVLLRGSDSLRLRVDPARSDGTLPLGATTTGSPENSPSGSPLASPQPLPRLGGPSSSPATAFRGTTPPPSASSAQSMAPRPTLPSPRQPGDRRHWMTPSQPERAEAHVTKAEEPAARRQWTAQPTVPVQSPAPAFRSVAAPEQVRQPERRQWTSPAAAGYPDSGARGPGSQTPRSGQTPKASAPAVGMLTSSELSFGQVLGSGGFGSVYRGSYRGQEVAIKRLHPSEGDISSAQLEEFRKEVANLSLLAHPRLIRFVGAAFTPPNLCIVTEFMPNGSLYSLLHNRKQPLDSVQKLSMSTQVVEGVDFLHGLSPPFVHRDLKSLNVVLDFALGVKLCDFGLTQSMEKTHITRRENECGSPRYMAPELFDSRGKITEKVDVWALGCLVLEIHLCKLPHSECQSLPQVMDKTLVRRELPFASDDAEVVGLDVRTLAELCLEYCPKRRIDAATFLEGLRGLAP